jgi:hypothetical protein
MNEKGKMKPLFRRTQKFILMMLFLVPAIASAATFNNLTDFLKAAKTCNTLSSRDVLIYSPDSSVTLLMSSDPQGYCSVIVQSKTPETNAASQNKKSRNPGSIQCHLSQKEVEFISNPEVTKNITQSTDGNTTSESNQLITLLKPIYDCVQKNLLPSVSNPNATPPPSYAVPVGSTLPLPPGVVQQPAQQSKSPSY